MADNIRIYKFLKSKIRANKKGEYEFDRSVYNTASELLPQQQPIQKDTGEEQKSPDINSIVDKYDEKLRLVEKNQKDRLATFSKASQGEMNRLGEQIKQGKEENLELSDSLKDAIQQLSKSRQEQKEGSPEEVASDEENGNTSKVSPKDTRETDEDTLVIPAFVAPAEDESTVEQPASTGDNTSVVEKVAKQIVNINDTIEVGNHIYKFTNLFGPRSGKNSVSGRADGEHSRGIDIIGYSKDGKKSNVPVALTDGTILGVTLQGNGKAIRPEQGRAAGYYMDVKMPDGKVMKYMHLGKDAFLNKASLIGKEIKRGDILYDGDYSVGSGSQTGPHVKVSISSVDGSGKQLYDYDSPENNPTPYALYGKYVQEE